MPVSVRIGLFFLHVVGPDNGQGWWACKYWRYSNSESHNWSSWERTDFWEKYSSKDPNRCMHVVWVLVLVNSSSNQQRSHHHLYQAQREPFFEVAMTLQILWRPKNVFFVSQYTRLHNLIHDPFDHIFDGNSPWSFLSPLWSCVAARSWV